MKGKLSVLATKLNSFFYFTFWGYYFSVGFFWYPKSRSNECIVI